MTNHWLIIANPDPRPPMSEGLRTPGDWRGTFTAPLAAAVGDAVVLWRIGAKGIRSGIVAIGRITTSTPAVEPRFDQLFRSAFSRSTEPTRSEPAPEPTISKISVDFDTLLLTRPLMDTTLHTAALSGLVKQARAAA